MLDGKYYVAMTVCKDCKIWEDVWYKSEEKAKEAAEKLAVKHGGKAVVEEIEW